MSITDEKRNEILAENNTAQRDFINILKQLSKDHADDIRFSTPAHGDLDFSEIKDQGFKHITSIIFDHSGNVTNIRNIPDGVKILDCAEQMLVDLVGLPESIEELTIDGNYLKKFDAQNLIHLRILRISNNELEELINLPATLEEIYCDNNSLRHIDLAGTPELHTLHCSNNELLVVANPPSTLLDFQMNDNPLTEIIHEKTKEKNHETKVDYMEAMYTYFALKRRYEEKVKQMKRTAYHKGEGKKSGLKKARAVKPPCVNCKRPVGTVFDRKNNRYTAICGDKKHPCNLNIQLFSGRFFNVDTLLNIYAEDLDKTKENIIRQKMDTLFNYLSEDDSIDKFKEELELYNQDSKMYKELLDRYRELYENEEQKLQISKKTAEMYKAIEEIGVHMKEYETSGNREALASALHIQKRDLIPAIQGIRVKKWGMMEVVVSPENDSSRLVQAEVPLYKTEFKYGEPSRVIKF